MASERVRDDAWHNALVKEYFERIARVLASKLRGDMATARDLAQETLITAWRKSDAVPEEPYPWLITTAKFHLSNYLRAHRNQPHQEYDPDTMAHLNPQPPADAMFDEPSLELCGQLDRLHPNDIELLELYYEHQLDTNEIAAHLNLRPATARKRLSRARVKATAILEEHLRSKGEPK